MKIYISGPITGLPGLNKSAFSAVEQRIAAAGHRPVNPHVICRGIPVDATHEVFMIRCLACLKTCDALVALPGYTESKGAQEEHRAAKEWGIPLISVDSLENNLYP